MLGKAISLSMVSMPRASQIPATKSLWQRIGATSLKIRKYSDLITPFISKGEYQSRRKAVVENMAPSSLCIVPGNTTHFATGSVFYEFRQDPRFQYLTGFLEPDALLLLHKPKNGKPSSHLFVLEKDPQKEMWEGTRTGTVQAHATYGVDEALPTEAIPHKVASLLQDVDTIYMDQDDSVTVRFGKTWYLDFAKAVPALIDAKKCLKDVAQVVDPLRLIKSENEIDCLRRACEISAEAFNDAYNIRFESERLLHAFLDFSFRQGGCEHPAYLPVVAGGVHGLTIHYVRNDGPLNDGDLVLVDAGGRFGGYCADISRSWPINGTFTAPQQDLYEAVLAVEKACIKLCTVSSGLSLNDVHRVSVQLMQKELRNAGLDLSLSQVQRVYPHSIGHNLGLDVHDVGGFNSRRLIANQVVTIEPGVYVPVDDDFPEAFRGIGIRIEDDVVVGKTIPEVLTIDCFKEVEQIARADKA